METFSDAMNEKKSSIGSSKGYNRQAITPIEIDISKSLNLLTSSQIFKPKFQYYCSMLSLTARKSVLGLNT
jgi:hypothetical protein